MAKPIKMIAKNSQTYLGYLNELVNECNNSYHILLVKMPLMVIILLLLIKFR